MENIHQIETALPVAEGNRLKVIDALRGVALLGILLMNMPGFSMPDYSFETFKNDPSSINFWVYAVISVSSVTSSRPAIPSENPCFYTTPGTTMYP